MLPWCNRCAFCYSRGMRHFLLVILAFAACATPRGGRVELGQTPADVQVALGKPDKVYSLVSETDNLEIWAYSIYRRAFDVSGQPTVGQTPRNVPGGGIRDDERVRVVFRGGKVVLVESRER